MCLAHLQKVLRRQQTFLAPSNATGWPVSYHGTACRNTVSIAKEGYRLSKCRRFSYGVRDLLITAPKSCAALRRDAIVNGESCMLVTQNQTAFEERQTALASTGLWRINKMSDRMAS